jgi:hypothetical protein
MRKNIRWLYDSSSYLRFVYLLFFIKIPQNTSAGSELVCGIFLVGSMDYNGIIYTYKLLYSYYTVTIYLLYTYYKYVLTIDYPY